MVSEFGHLRESRCPAYDLAHVRAALENGRFRVTQRVLEHMWSRGHDSADLLACMASMRPASYYKSQEARDGSGAWLDIYRPYWGGERWYIKFVAYADGSGYRVLSFCLDGEQH